MYRTALKFSAITLAVLYTATFVIVWFFTERTVLDISNIMTMVAVVAAILSSPFFGAGFVGARQLNPDPRESEQGPGTLPKPARGLLVLVVAVLWLSAGIAIHKVLGV